MKIRKDDDLAVIALSLTYRVILPRLLNLELPSQLRMKRPSYESGMTRTHQFMLQMAKELGEEWRDLVISNEESSVSDWRRIEKMQLQDAAIELMMVVRDMPQPLREVVERRAAGMSWKKISDELPKRAYFSLTDDWQNALRRLNERHITLIMRFI